jgi:hypothetical protein
LVEEAPEMLRQLEEVLRRSGHREGLAGASLPGIGAGAQGQGLVAVHRLALARCFAALLAQMNVA